MPYIDAMEEGWRVGGGEQEGRMTNLQVLGQIPQILEGIRKPPCSGRVKCAQRERGGAAPVDVKAEAGGRAAAAPRGVVQHDQPRAARRRGGRHAVDDSALGTSCADAGSCCNEGKITDHSFETGSSKACRLGGSTVRQSCTHAVLT